MSAVVIRKVSLNGMAGRPDVIVPWIQALNNRDVVLEKAGFIFKAGLADGGHFMLAVEPCLIHGERRYHYNMHLADKEALTLVGNVDAQGEFTIAFKAPSLQMTAEQKSQYLALYREFARLLLEQGYAGEGTLNDITQCVLAEIGRSPAPRTLAELAT